MVRAAFSAGIRLLSAPVRPARRRAFTLTELLVVIAFVTFIFSLLLPATQRAKDQSQRHVVRASLRELSAAMSRFYLLRRVFPTEEELASAPDTDSFQWDGRRIVHETLDFRYVIQATDSATASFTLCAIPIAPYGDGSFVFCIKVDIDDESIEFFEDGPLAEALAEEAARWRAATAMALDSTARLLLREPVAGNLRPFLALPETRNFVFRAMDRNGDELITKAETIEFLTPVDGEPAAIAEMKTGLRDILFVLRLDQGDYEGARIADLQGDPASLYSADNWRLYHHTLIDHDGVVRALSAKVDAAAMARQRLEKLAVRDACAGIVKAYRNELDAQVFKTISFDAALKLDALIGIECPDEGPF
jgi:type II secretory pathway pseudopilin PulG